MPVGTVPKGTVPRQDMCSAGDVRMKIVVDAMGGDYAPQVVIDGTIAAVKEYNAEVVLVGDELKIKSLLKKAKYTADKISVFPAQGVIGMSEPAAASVRRKRNSSIVVGVGLVKDGLGDAFFSAGRPWRQFIVQRLDQPKLEKFDGSGSKSIGGKLAYRGEKTHSLGLLYFCRPR